MLYEALLAKTISGSSGGGGGDNVFAIELSWDDEASTTVMNKTVQEIMEAANSGKMLWVYAPSEAPKCGFVSDVGNYGSVYVVSVAIGVSSITVEGETKDYIPAYVFTAESLTGYPSNADF